MLFAIEVKAEQGDMQILIVQCPYGQWKSNDGVWWIVHVETNEHARSLWECAAALGCETHYLG